MYKKSLVAFAFFASVALQSDIVRADHLSDARAGMEKRFELLRDVRIEYDLQESHTPELADPKMYASLKASNGRDLGGGARMGPLLEGEITKHCMWRRLNDCIRLEMSDDGTAPAALRTMHLIASAYGNRIDMLTNHASIDRRDDQEIWTFTPEWAIAARDQDPLAEIDVVLGLRFRQGDRLTTLAELKGLEVVHCDADNLLLSRLERHQLHLFRFSAKYGWALEEYRMLQSGYPSMIWTCDDFRQVDGVWMPYRAKYTFTSPAEGAIGPSQTKTVTVKKIEFAPQDGGEASFPIVFKNGSIVHDLRSGWSFKIQTGDQVITDEKIAARLETYRRFEQDAQERISKGWKPTDAELDALLAEYFKDLKR